MIGIFLSAQVRVSIFLFDALNVIENNSGRDTSSMQIVIWASKQCQIRHNYLVPFAASEL